MASGLYLFCLTRLEGLPPFEGRMIDGLGPMTLRVYQDIVAVLSEISLEDAGSESGEPTSEETARTLQRILRHEAVVEETMRASGVLPARLGTVFSRWESLERVLRTHHDTISRFLDQAADCEEWAIKAFLDRPKANESLLTDKLAQAERRLAALSPGMRYLQEQRLRKELGNEATQKMRMLCRQAEERLCGHATDYRRRDLLRPEACGAREMLMNLAFWVPRKNTQAFKACLGAVKGLQTDGALAMECTGPWPPYSFSPCLEMEAAS
jgi:hypothetical protein